MSVANQHRAARMEAILKQNNYLDGMTYDSAISDLLSDLRHLLEREAIEIDHVLYMSAKNFEMEVAEDFD
jgi:hypothetical protein